jgi:1,4-dihydroxy-2-naphthoyl-CoA synthase
VTDFAPDFFRSGGANEGKNAFAERREPDFSKYPCTAGVYTPRKS